MAPSRTTFGGLNPRKRRVPLPKSLFPNLKNRTPNSGLYITLSDAPDDEPDGPASPSHGEAGLCGAQAGHETRESATSSPRDRDSSHLSLSLAWSPRRRRGRVR